MLVYDPPHRHDLHLAMTRHCAIPLNHFSHTKTHLVSSLRVAALPQYYNF